jgi:hypothetical protein
VLFPFWQLLWGGKKKKKKKKKKTVDAIGLARMRDGGTAELEACEVAFFLWDKTLHVPHEGKKELHTFVVRAIQSAR